MTRIPNPKYSLHMPETPTCGINSTREGFLGCVAYINKKQTGKDKRMVYIENKGKRTHITEDVLNWGLRAMLAQTAGCDGCKESRGRHCLMGANHCVRAGEDYYGV